MKTLRYSVLIIVCTLAFVYYQQYVGGLEPCPLCIMQRLMCWLMLIVAGATTLVPPLKKIIVPIFSSLIVFALAGLYFAMRQVWIQHAGLNAVPQCAPSLHFMLANYPMHQALSTLFYGSGDCAKVHWHFLGLSLAEWSVLFFVSAVSVWSLWLITAIKLRFRSKTHSIEIE